MAASVQQTGVFFARENPVSVRSRRLHCTGQHIATARRTRSNRMPPPVFGNGCITFGKTFAVTHCALTLGMARNRLAAPKSFRAVRRATNAGRTGGQTDEAVPDRDKNGRSSIAIAMTWVHQITGVALMMAVPIGAGYYVDQWWGTVPWLTCIGAVLGFAAGMQQLLAIARRSEARAAKNSAAKKRQAGKDGVDRNRER